jgi:chromate reductase
LSFCNSSQMNAPEAYIQFSQGLISDAGEVSVQTTEQFLRGYMEEFVAFVTDCTRKCVLSGRIRC